MANKERKRPLYYGGRKTDKLIRCYWKNGKYRLEVEGHSGLLRNVSTLDDFLLLPGIIHPRHLELVEWDWKRLERYLRSRCGGDGPRVIAGAKRRSSSLRRLRRYLRKHGVVNLHRFLVPLPVNKEIDRALQQWARDFKKGSLWAKGK